MSLSVVIPTYNRVDFLKPLLEDLYVAIMASGEDVEIIVINNCSTDGTKAFLEDFRRNHSQYFSCRHQAYNIGMEGNIVSAVMAGTKKYTWLLSDHQKIHAENVIRACRQMSTLDFDFACAKITQWEAVLGNSQCASWAQLTDVEKGRMLFTLGNMSCLIFKTALRNKAIAEVFRGCDSGYPHLGLLYTISRDSVFTEFTDMSELPTNVGKSKIKHSYDILIARYRSNLLCVERASAQAGFAFRRNDFFTKNYRKSFLGDVLSLLLIDRGSSRPYSRRLWKIIPKNPFLLQLTAVGVLLVLNIFPEKLRLGMAESLKRLFKKRILS